MAKISKTQAEAAYRILRSKINKLQEEKFEEVKKNFKTLYPEQYNAMEEYSDLMDKANLIRKNFENNVKYCIFWQGYGFDEMINTAAHSAASDMVPTPSYDEFIDNLLIKGETDITEYIDEFFNKLIKNA